jgi:hypothetical protein
MLRAWNESRAVPLPLLLLLLLNLMPAGREGLLELWLQTKTQMLFPRVRPRGEETCLQRDHCARAKGPVARQHDVNACHLRTLTVRVALCHQRSTAAR